MVLVCMVLFNLHLAQRIQKKQYETASPKYQSLKAGDYVWYYNPRKAFKGDKHLAWRGPYLVKNIADDFTVTLQLDLAGTTYRTHCDKLRIARGVNNSNWAPR